MAEYMRLRQICLVAPHLEPAISDIAAIMGLSICYRDGNVAKYGLENALLPVDTILLEVVAPTQPGTAAGRFLDKTGNRGGYMAIFCCEDPDARGAKANAMGVRTANVITHAPYHGVQLHPRDCRAAFIEFNHTDGSDDVLGTYPPAGPDWQKSIRKDTTLALTEVEMQSPEPQALAEHWGRIIGVGVTKGADGPVLKLPNATFRFVKGPVDLMTGLSFRVKDAAQAIELLLAPIDTLPIRTERVGLRGISTVSFSKRPKLSGDRNRHENPAAIGREYQNGWLARREVSGCAIAEYPGKTGEFNALFGFAALKSVLGVRVRQDGNHSEHESPLIFTNLD